MPVQTYPSVSWPYPAAASAVFWQRSNVPREQRIDRALYEQDATQYAASSAQHASWPAQSASSTAANDPMYMPVQTYASVSWPYPAAASAVFWQRSNVPRQQRIERALHEQDATQYAASTAQHASWPAQSASSTAANDPVYMPVQTYPSVSWPYPAAASAVFWQRSNVPRQQRIDRALYEQDATQYAASSAQHASW